MHTGGYNNCVKINCLALPDNMAILLINTGTDIKAPHDLTD